MREQLAAYFQSHQMLVESSALQLILTTPTPLDLSRQLIEGASAASPFVTLEMVETLLAKHAGRSLAASIPMARAGGLPEPEPPFRLVAEGYQAGGPDREPLQAYGELFASRFRSLARMVRARPELKGYRPVRELRKSEGRVSVVGMVRAVHATSEKRHLILSVEDESGVVELLVPRDSEAAMTPFLVDEVVGVQILLPKETDRLPRVLAALRPDIPVQRPVRRGPARDRVLFLSDLHIGSKSFLAEPWAGLIEFLQGKGPHPELAAEIRHVVVAGDLVDGIGIYPNQERDLAIGDVFEQYAELGRRLAELPGRLDVVVVPGNHDAVCPAEPQPSLPPEIRASLPANVHSISNPSTFALDGVVIEAYHGRSFDDLIPAIPGATYARPTEVMKRMLAMRHLAPIYGGRTPLAPLPHDGLVIESTPEILVTGHAHTYGVDQYHGVLLLNASTWQAETEYQRMRNISPVPAHGAVVDLSDLGVTTLDFSSGRAVARVGA
ncbi:MAG TPA: metallophosphoesterase [Thermoplasmata archaeon]|nr:metallophosphoesterase [Thermoplasmata archaeon]